MTRSTSPDGIDLIKRFEGYERYAYRDIAGIWTIGYGHASDILRDTIQSGSINPQLVGIVEFDGRGDLRLVTDQSGEELLRRDLRPRERSVVNLVKVVLNQNEFDALVSFVYNVGAGAFARSTALRRLNKGNRAGAADALTWFNKARVGGNLREVRGLTRRRAAEKALFLTPPQSRPPAPASVYYCPNDDARAPAIERRRIFGL